MTIDNNAPAMGQLWIESWLSAEMVPGRVLEGEPAALAAQQLRRQLAEHVARIVDDARAYYLRSYEVVISPPDPDSLNWPGTAHYRFQVQLDVALMDWKEAEVGEVARDIPWPRREPSGENPRRRVVIPATQTTPEMAFERDPVGWRRIR